MMASGPFTKFLTGVAIVLLHLPLIYFVATLSAELAPGQDITDLSAVSVLILLALLILPYSLLAGLGVRWNPARARLNEVID